MPAVAAGNLNKWTRIERPVETQNPVTGEIETAWVTFSEQWTDVNYQSVREFVAASAEQSEVRGHMQIRYRDGIDATMRVVHRGKWFGILGVMPDNESGTEHLTLAVAEGVRLDQ